MANKSLSNRYLFPRSVLPKFEVGLEMGKEPGNYSDDIRPELDIKMYFFLHFSN